MARSMPAPYRTGAVDDKSHAVDFEDEHNYGEGQPTSELEWIDHEGFKNLPVLMLFIGIAASLVFSFDAGVGAHDSSALGQATNMPMISDSERIAVDTPENTKLSPMCKASDLKPVMPRPPDGGAGHFALVLQVSNISGRNCILPQAPTVRLLDNRGSAITMPTCLSCPSYLIGTNPTKAIDLRLHPGHSAYSVISYTTIVGKEHNCHTVDAIEMDFGDSRGVLRFRYERFRTGIDVCDQIEVRAWTMGEYVPRSIP